MMRFLSVLLSFFITTIGMGQQKVATVKRGKLWGVINDKGDIIVPTKYANINELSHSVFVVKKWDSWGAVDLNGNEIIDPVFAKLHNFAPNGIARATLGESYVNKHNLPKEYIGKHIFIDLKGNQIGNLFFKKAYDFKDGVAIVVDQSDRKFYVNSTLQEIVIQQGDEKLSPGIIHPFSEQRGKIELKDLIGFIDSLGHVIIPPIYKDAKNFKKGQAIVLKDNYWGIINKNGRFIAEPKYSRIGPLNEGYRVVEIRDRYGLIDSLGNTIIEPSYESVFSTGSGKWSVYNKKDGFGILETNGHYLPFSEEIQDHQKFQEGYAMAKGKKGWGLINDKSEWVAPPIYDRIKPVFNGMAKALLDEEERWFYVTIEGKELKIEGAHLLNDLGTISEGLIATRVDDQIGYVNANGQWVLQPQFDAISLQDHMAQFKDGIAIMKKDGKHGCINTKGEWVIEPLYAKIKPFISIPTPSQEKDLNSLRGYLNYSKSPSGVEGVKVYLIDNKGDTIGSTTTVSKGFFTFNELPKNKEYLITLDEAIDAEMIILDKKGAKEQVVLIYNGQSFSFTFLGSDASTTISLLENEDNTSISGFFSYTKLGIDEVEGLVVHLTDDEGNVIFTTVTNKLGHFKFKNLDPDKNYLIKLDNTDPNLELVILGEGSEGYTAVLSSDNKGVFLYHKLKPDQIGGLGLLYSVDGDMEDLALTKTLKGQFRFRHLSMDSLNGIVVQLIDTAGNILYTTTTTDGGIFVFKDLPYEGNYIVKLKEPDPNVELLIINDNGVVAELNANKNGEFIFLKLTQKAVTSLTNGNGNNTALYTTKSSIMLQFKRQYLSNNMVSNAIVKARNKIGKIIGTGRTDSEGKVYLDRISDGDEMVFELITESNDTSTIAMDIYNSESNLIATIFSEDKIFKYTFSDGDISKDLLQMDDSEDMSIKPGSKSVIDEGEVVIKKITNDIFIIYFGFNASEYNYSGKVLLDNLVKNLKSNTSLKVDITAYSDGVGSNDYNQNLSNERAKSVVNHLIKNGIVKSRITYRGLGATNFVVSCDPCTDQQNQRNRRAVLRIQ